MSFLTTHAEFVQCFEGFFERSVSRDSPGYEVVEAAVNLLGESLGSIKRPLRDEKPVVRYLQDLKSPAGNSDLQNLLQSFIALEPYLCWQQNPGYTEKNVGARFIDNYGYVNLIGKSGVVSSDSLLFGALLLGPRTLYPEHSHPAAEVYYPLCGEALWRADTEEFCVQSPGKHIYHPPTVIHAMQTKNEPFLAIYCWQGKVSTPASLEIEK